MKHFIWMLCGIFISGLLLGTLSACGADSFAPVAVATAKQPAPPEAVSAPEEQLPKDPPGPRSSIAAGDGEARMAAYGKALWDMYLQGVLPDGTRLDWTGPEGAAENRFALADVDGGGEEELVVYWTNACTAGMRGLVYGYEDGALRLVFSEFPDLTFYENGAVTAGWSHSQGWAGRFWPITLYQYRPDSGVYEEIGSVDAWDLECTEGDETLAAAFPRETDADGDGLVYYILTGEWYRNDRVPSDGRLDGRLWNTDPVDGAELEAWLESYTGGTESMGLPFQPLTEENIAALGCPKPDCPAREAAG